jgi:hypothetical protein
MRCVSLPNVNCALPQSQSVIFYDSQLDAAEVVISRLRRKHKTRSPTNLRQHDYNATNLAAGAILLSAST